ncbi:CBS domain-containing protein [Streptomyces longispororuber]|uniref:CBS domain-containing protein n=1 Tax=Streptomyces longispororuber TaxID=68230 RepID=UPI0033D21496
MTVRTVGEVMTKNVVQTSPTTPLQHAVRLLDRHRLSGLPVVDEDDKVLGVTSRTDLVRARTGRSGRLDRSPADAVTVTVTVGDVMSSPAVTVHPEQTVPDAARLMGRRGVERLPVVDEEDRLIGIATRSDLLRVFLRTDDDIRRQVTEEILVGALGLPPDAVRPSVRDGVVTLVGHVDLRGQAAEAVHRTWRLDGVVGVVNGLTYGGGSREKSAVAGGRTTPL